jgi:hypothetical protein
MDPVRTNPEMDSPGRLRAQRRVQGVVAQYIRELAIGDRQAAAGDRTDRAGREEDA